jgi:hypothetical protein
MVLVLVSIYVATLICFAVYIPVTYPDEFSHPAHNLITALPRERLYPHHARPRKERERRSFLGINIKSGRETPEVPMLVALSQATACMGPQPDQFTEVSLNALEKVSTVLEMIHVTFWVT